MPNMTLSDFDTHLNLKYGFNEWPKTYHVSPELFGEICAALFESKLRSNQYSVVAKKVCLVSLCITLNGGVMFKGIEILIEPPKIEVTT